MNLLTVVSSRVRVFGVWHLVVFTYGVALSDDARRPCRQTPNLAFGHFDALLRFSSTGYSPDVADHSAIGLGNPSNRNATAPQLRPQKFFTTAILSNGGCAWDAFGRAGSMVSGFPTCA